MHSPVLHVSAHDGHMNLHYRYVRRDDPREAVVHICDSCHWIVVVGPIPQNGMHYDAIGDKQSNETQEPKEVHQGHKTHGEAPTMGQM